MRSATPPRPTTPARTGIGDNFNIVFRQFLTLAAGEGGARLLHAVALLLLARRAGPAAFGEFGTAQSIAGYGALLVQCGLDTPATRAAVRSPNGETQLRSAVLALRAPAALAVTLAAVLWRDPILLAMCGVWLAAALQMRWLLVARGRSRTVSIGALLSAVVFLCAVAFELPIAGVAIALGLGEVAGAAYGLWESRGPLAPSGEWRWALSRQALPFLAAILLGNLLYNLDVFVLSALRSKEEVGLYLAAYRLTTVFGPVLSAMQLSALPEFARLAPDYRLANGLASMLLPRAAIAALVPAVALAALPTGILHIFYGKAFDAASPLVVVLGFVLPLQVTRMIFRQALLAFGGERRDLLNLMAAVAVNAAIDLAFVPEFGAMACAAATLAAEAVLGLLTWQAWRARCA